MKNIRLALALMVGMSVSACVWAADPPPLLIAQGMVEKVDANTLTVKLREPSGPMPRGLGGFGKNLVLKITGTSMVKTLSPRMQKSSMVIAQVDTKFKDLQAKQAIALVYTMVKDNPVLLTAVVQPPREK